MVLANLTCTTSLNSKKMDVPFTLTRSANVWIVLKKKKERERDQFIAGFCHISKGLFIKQSILL